MAEKIKTIPDFTTISYHQYQQQYPEQPISRATYQRYRAKQLAQTISATINSENQSLAPTDTRSIIPEQKETIKSTIVNENDKHCIVSRSIDCLKVAVLTQPLAAQWALERLAPEVFAKKEHTTVTANNIGIKLVFGGKRKPKDVTAQVL